MKAFLLSFLFAGLYFQALAQYRLYETEFNQINQTIIKTRDGGFLIAAIQFCYTPEEWVIEGCPVGIHLIKIDEFGDTIWTRQIVNHDVQGLLYVFENADETYSLITSQDKIFTCHEWIIGPDIGLLQTAMYEISNEGEVTTITTFPNDCSLFLIDAERMNDSTFILLTRYSEPFASDTIEGRMYVLDKAGTILRTRIFPQDQMQKGNILLDSQFVKVVYVDKDSVLRLKTFDRDLNVVEESANPGINSYCLSAEETRASAALLRNDSVFIMCDNPFAKGENTELLTFDASLDLISQKRYVIPFASGFTINAANEIIVLSEVQAEDSSDIKLTFFTTLGDSIQTRSYRIPGNQSPSQVIPIPHDRLAIVGSHNCCNLDTTIGPGHTFLYMEDLPTSTEYIFIKNNVLLYPNPTNNMINIDMEKEGITGENLKGKIYSISGAFIKNFTVNDQSAINVRDLPEGMYYLVVELPDGTLVRNSFVRID